MATSSSISDLVRISNVIRSIGLTTSIRSTAKVFCEWAAGMCISWLRNLPDMISPNFIATFREIISIALCTEIQGEKGIRPIDIFLEIDYKLWKDSRNAFRGLYVNTLLVGGDDLKKILASRFAMQYLSLAKDYIFAKREESLCILNFSVQVFTP